MPAAPAYHKRQRQRLDSAISLLIMSSSESSSSDSDIPTTLTQNKLKDGQNKSKVAKRTAIATTSGKNEGVDPDWAYKPPAGAVLAAASEDVGDFDWDALEDNDDIELWVMRVPEGVRVWICVVTLCSELQNIQLKMKHLDNLKLDTPTGSTSRAARMGSLDRKSATYDVWSLGEEADSVVGAEEMKTLSCLAPRQKKRGKLYLGTLSQT